MKLIGYWMANLRDSHLPLPQELVGEMSASVRDAVCKYLTSGKIFETYRGYSWCRFYCGVDHENMGFRELTDGEWVWPEGLVHYVRDHNVVLPDEFIASATSGKVAAAQCHDNSVSLDFWVEWGARHRSDRLRKRLSTALSAAEAAKPAVIESLVEHVLRRETESSESCIFAGCSRFGLAGRRVCARHMLDDQRIEFETMHLYQLPRLYDE